MLGRPIRSRYRSVFRCRRVDLSSLRSFSTLSGFGCLCGFCFGSCYRNSGFVGSFLSFRGRGRGGVGRGHGGLCSVRDFPREGSGALLDGSRRRGLVGRGFWGCSVSGWIEAGVLGGSGRGEEVVHDGRGFVPVGGYPCPGVEVDEPWSRGVSGGGDGNGGEREEC